MYAMRPKEDDLEHGRDAELLEQLEAAGVRYRRLSAEEHREHESAWRRVYGRAFLSSPRCRSGAKAVDEYLGQPVAKWLLVPFLSPVPGTPIMADNRMKRLSAFECEGPLVELEQFHTVEFFISPPDLSWTFVRTHEDFAFGGPYFMRAEWAPQCRCSKPRRT
jgi:hypothetical protein